MSARFFHGVEGGVVQVLDRGLGQAGQAIGVLGEGGEQVADLVAVGLDERKVVARVAAPEGTLLVGSFGKAS